MRTIKISIKDEETQLEINGVVSIDAVNSLYDKHGANGIMEIVYQINNELNDKSGKRENIKIPKSRSW